MNELNEDPTALLVAGDVHGDARHMAYLYEKAVEQKCHVIVQVGDFGYWEHYDDGVFLDLCEQGFHDTTEFGWPVIVIWIDGNHENHPLLYKLYGPGSPLHETSPEGFWKIREGLYYVPRGTRWVWSDVSFLGLGGAYSIDKNYRLGEQRKDGIERWWSTEQLTDEDVAHCLEDRSHVDVMFTHDKPRDVKVPWDRHDLPAAKPNQDKIQKVLDVLEPNLLIHGHLHLRYQARVGFCTVVEGLGCNPQQPGDNPEDSWLRLSIAEDYE